MYPNLDGVKRLAIDIETFDPNLKKLGPGVRRKDGHILCVAIASNDREWCFDWNEDTFIFLQEIKQKDYVTQNGIYDYDWMGYIPEGRLFDTRIAEALIDSSKLHYDLDSLAREYLGVRKGDDEIEAYAKAKGWLKRGHKSQEFLKDMPRDLVHKYAKKDVRQTYDIFLKQEPRLKEMELEKIFDIETRLLRPVLQMIQNGVRIDEEKLFDAQVYYKKKHQDIEREIREIIGDSVNIRSSKQLSEVYDKYNWAYHKTDKGNPSLGTAELENQDNPLSDLLIKYRKVDKLLSSFLGTLPNHLVNGRIHACINTIKGDRGGTETGRFSYYNPNLQQIPARDPEAKKILRGMFLPEHGEVWHKPDFSSEEPRVLAHYALGRGADYIRKQYNDDPRFDIYVYMATLTNYRNFNTSSGSERAKIRKLFKTIVLGLNYGMGIAKLAKSLGLTLDEAKTFKALVFRHVPWLKETFAMASRVAERRGYIKTIYGRRRSFDNPNFAYKGLNSVIQGSAGDIMKVAMVKAYDAGIFKEIAPLITVHDELDVSATPDKLPVVKELVRTMETCVPLSVPLVVDLESGPNWGEVK